MPKQQVLLMMELILKSMSSYRMKIIFIQRVIIEMNKKLLQYLIYLIFQIARYFYTIIFVHRDLINTFLLHLYWNKI